MKICLGIDGNNLESEMAKRFGHAAYYLIYDTENKTSEVLINKVDQDDNHDILYNIFDKGVKTFIVGNIGPHAFDILNSAGCKIYLARKVTAAHAIELFLKGELKELHEPTAKKSIGHGTHEHGGKHKHHHKSGN